jgi:hypothetical protein
MNSINVKEIKKPIKGTKSKIQSFDEFAKAKTDYVMNVALKSVEWSEIMKH